MTAEHSGRLSILQAVAIDDTRVGAAALRMLVTLGIYANTETGWCWPKQKTLADRLGVTRQAVSKALRDLASFGYLEIHEQHDPVTGSQIGSHYRLVMDFELPVQYRRTPQPDIAGGINLTLRPPQPDVADPATLEVAPPATSEIAPPATSDVAAIEEERPRKNDPKERPKREPAGAGDEQRLFDYYREKIQPKARVNAPEKIRARLKTFSADELCRAIDNFAADWWWMKHNATQGVEWFFRSDRQVERFLNMVPRPEPEGDPRAGRTATRRPDDHLTSTAHRTESARF
jgi:hypothetical protein